MFLRKKRFYDTEEAIINACKDNDREAQKMLYAQYSGLFFGICLRYMKDQRDAEEVLTNAFMKIYENIGKFRSEGSFEGWMKRIVVNEALSYIRKNRNMYVEVDIEDHLQESDFSWNQCDLELEDLLRLINNLPSGYRTVFNLYAIEGFSHKEISEKLNISVNTSKSQYSRARMILQEKSLKMNDLNKKKG